MLWVTLVVKNTQTKASLQIWPMTSPNVKERKILRYASKTITRATFTISEGGVYRRLPLDCSFNFSTSDHK